MNGNFFKDLERAHLTPEMANTRLQFAEPDVLRSLRDYLFAQSAPMMDRGMCLHVLVDPILADPLKDSNRRKLAIDLPLMARGNDQVRAPYLLPLGEIGRDETIDTSLDLGFAEAKRHYERDTRGSTICAWLVCPAGDEMRIVQSLAEVARRRAAPSRESVLRLWDPRVFELLIPQLSTLATRELTGEAAGWWWINRSGHLVSRPAGDSVARADGGTGWTSPNTLHLLAAAGAVNGVLNALQDANVAFDHLPSTSAILSLIARGQTQWGLADDFDLIRFALYGVLVRTDFDGDPDVRAAMIAARARGDACVEALTSFDESHWKQRRYA